jgi:hypothetical protein
MTEELKTKYGILLRPDIKLQRQYFKEMCKLIGINCIYRAVRPGKKYTNYAELDTNFEKPILLGCIFDEHPTQQTLKKIGWVSELQESSSIIHVPYDTPNIQQGCIFTLPSGLDDGKGRLFRLVKLSNIMVYPASMACEIVPEYENTYHNALNDFSENSFNLLQEEEYKL